MSIELAGPENTVAGKEYEEEIEVLADEIRDLIAWGVNTEQDIKRYLKSEDAWNSAEQTRNVEDALDYLQEEEIVTKSFKRYSNGLEIGYRLADST